MGEVNNSSGKYQYSLLEIIVGILFWGFIAIMIFAFISESISGVNNNDKNNQEINQVDPYYGYSDGIDQDCADIGMRVFVGSNDPDRLDADGDGWGCESYGG